MTTIAIIALAWAGVAVVGTLLVVSFLRVGAKADTEHDRVLIERTLGLEGIREHPVVVARALHVASRRPRG